MEDERLVENLEMWTMKDRSRKISGERSLRTEQSENEWRIKQASDMKRQSTIARMESHRTSGNARK